MPTFEALFGVKVDLLGLGNFLEQFLNHYSVKIACFAVQVRSSVQAGQK
jgi:hypothetical protein